MTVIFGKGRKRISTIFMMDEFLDMKSDLYPIAISSYLREMVYKLNEKEKQVLENY